MKIPCHGAHIRINPGEYFVSRDDVVVYTILGSCVSACLYDPVNKIVGMNHFLLSNPRYAKNMPISLTEAGRYGIHSMELLINEMLRLGAKRYNLRAKAFGGSSLLGTSVKSDNFFCVGQVNTKFIIEFLQNEGIPLVNADLGGDRGRVIYFCSEDHSVFMKNIKPTVNQQLLQREKQYWQHELEDHEKKVAEPDIWL